MLISRLTVVLAAAFGLLISSTAMAKQAFPTGTKFRLIEVDTDVIAGQHATLYALEERVVALLQQEIQQQLADRGLLAAEDETGKPLVIRLDYQRRFAGEALLGATKKMGAAEYQFDLRSKPRGKGTLYYQSRRRMLRKFSFTLVGVKHTFQDATPKKDIALMWSVASSVSNKIAALVGQAKLPEDSPAITAAKGRLEQAAKLEMAAIKKRGNKIPQDYLPASVNKDYLTRLKNAKGKKRLALYREVTDNAWLLSPQFYGQLKKRLDWQVEKNQADAKEIGLGIKALATSGNRQYDKIIAGYGNSTKSGKVRKHAIAALKVLKERASYGDIVHTDSKVTKGLDWRQRQLVNMLHSGIAELQMQAIRPISRSYLKDRKVTDAVAAVLQRSAERGGMRSSEKTKRFRKPLSDKFEAHACKILANSKVKAYYPVLVALSKSSASKYVRKYAKATAKKLK